MTEELAVRIARLLRQRVSGELAPPEFLDLVEDQLAGLALYPREAVWRLGIVAGDILDEDPPAAIEVVLQFISSISAPTRALAACVIWRLARFQPGIWEESARHLTRDDDWEVRDLAAHVFDNQSGEDGAAEFHRDYVNECVERWIADPDYLVRRAATQALTGFATKHPEQIAGLLLRLTPLLDDPAEYVRRGLALTLRMLGRRNPLAVIEFMEANLSSPSAAVGDTIELALENSFADRFPEQKMRILRRLHSGERGEPQAD